MTEADTVVRPTLEKHSSTNDSAMVPVSEPAIDALPPLEAPPIERNDSLPPLEAVVERPEGTSIADGTQSTHIESHLTHTNNALTDNTNSTATPMPPSAPTIDLRALINKLAPIPIHNPAANTATSPSTTNTTIAPTPQPAFMTLDDWRKLSQTRPELSMKVLGEPADKKKKERALTGMGGGWKGTEGWKCESLNCIQFENRKYDGVCARCGAVRRFQRA